MSNNAMWRVNFRVRDVTGDFSRAIYLASPDLRDTKEAKRRATKTARERLAKKLRKEYGERRKFEVVHIDTTCVG